MTSVIIKSGDILDEKVEVLISTANPQLNMSGGVNGAILQKGGVSIQKQLRDYLATTGKYYVLPETVVVTDAGTLPIEHIVHAVAIDAFYESSVQMVTNTLVKAFSKAAELGVSTAVPALATGYGPLKSREYAQALSNALKIPYPSLEEIRVVLWKKETAQVVYETLKQDWDQGKLAELENLTMDN